MAIRLLGHQPQLRRHRLFDLLGGLAALVVLVRLCLFVVYEPYFEGDTELLVKGHIKAIRECLSEGRFSGCPGSGVFPLLQNIPSLILDYLSFSPAAILHSLAYLSFISFLGSVALTFWTLNAKASRKEAATGVLILITSPLLWYSHSTFGEMTSAFLILAFTASALVKARGWMVALLFVMAGCTKEVALPFLFLIGLVCLLPEITTDWRRVIRRVGWLAVGAILTFAVTAGFNYFRFGTLSNPNYVTKLFIVPTLRIQLSFFFGIWFSPNGGLLFFWPLFTLLYLSIVGGLILKFLRHRPVRQGQIRELLTEYLPISTISAILLVLTVGFARWYTPLGGYAWGPRYMLPWIPSVTLLLLHFYRAEVTHFLASVLAKPIRLILSAFVLILLSIPQFAILFDSSVMGRIFSYPECPRVPVIQEGVDYYYQCLQTQIWPKSLSIIGLYQVVFRPSVVWFALAYAITLSWIIYSIGSELASEKKLRANLIRIRMALGNSRYHAVLVAIFYSLLFLAFFSPIILKGSLLAVGGDGLYIYLPNFYSRKVLWDTLLFSGFPMMADPQVMSWYPPAILLSLLPGTWNLFILSAYVAGSSLTYGYVYTLTKSRLAAAFSGAVFGLSGFMVAHLGHAVIIHAAAWIPLIIWSLEMLRRRYSAFWFVAGSVAIALSCTGGHSQIFVYGLILSVAYVGVVGWSAPVGRWRYYSVALATIAAGVAIAAVQILPAAELVAQSTRVSYSYQDFVSHALTPRQTLTIIFPLVFGGVPEAGFLPYFGAVNQTELTGYVGLLPLVLAAVGIISARRKSLALFWLCAALVALLLAMGDATPLARITYRVPVINQMRAPARHLITLTFAISVLSGFGLAALQRGEVSRQRLARLLVSAALVMLFCLIALFLNSKYLSALAAQHGIAKLSLLPWANRAVAIPLVVALLGIIVLVRWYKQPSSPVWSALLLLVLLVDLGSFGWFYEWRYAIQDKNALIPTADAIRYRELLQTSNQRLMPFRGPRGRLGEMPPNLTRLWQVPSASGYNVLIPARVSRLLPMIDYIDVPAPWQVPDDQSLNIVATRYLFMPRAELTPRVDGVSWLKSDFDVWLGSDCGSPRRDSVTFELPRPVKATHLGLVSRLACSSQIPQGTEVARYHLTDVNGVVHSGSLRAGIDMSEWAYECAVVKPHMKHQLAPTFRDYQAKMYDDTCVGHSYLSRPDLNGNAEIRTVRFDWTGPFGALLIEKLTLIDDLSKTSSPIDPSWIVNDRWRLVEETAEARVYENLKAMPRAWLVREVVNTSAEEALKAIKTSRLPGGRTFVADQTALVEEPVAMEVQEADPNASATVVGVSDVQMEIHTSSKMPAFLVTSDAYYPGWRASIDGSETKLLRADYVLRGVVVPPGQHVVKFEYRSRRFYLGALVSVLSLMLLGTIALTSFLRRRADQ